MKVFLISHTQDAEKIVAYAAKVCYSQTDLEGIEQSLTPEKTKDFVEMLMDIGHESPIEHASFTFGIEGVSRALLAQLTRHRIASYSVRSQRYVKEEGFSYVTPPEIQKNEKALEIYKKAMENDQKAYNELKEILIKEHTERLVSEGQSEQNALKNAEKMAIEDARFVLPNACETKLIVTMNTRSLYNFFSLRLCNRAQWEIRQLAELMLNEAKKASPVLFSNVGPDCVRGTCKEGKMTCGKAKQMKEKYGDKK